MISYENGLSLFGLMVVLEMNRLGMFIDLSHSSDNLTKTVLKISKAPVIFSHSNVRSVFDHTRNVDDEMLSLLVKNGGVVMLSTWAGHVKTENATISDLVIHAKYIKDTIGSEFIGIGGNFDDYPMVTLQDWQDVGGYEKFWEELRIVGFSEDEIRGVKGENLMRAMSEVERISETLRAKIGPNESRIPKKDLSRNPEWNQCRSNF